MKRVVVREVRIEGEDDLLAIRQAVRETSTSMGFTLVDQTRLLTAVSEITRNAYAYAGGGRVTLEQIESDIRRGLMVAINDNGPGIADISRVMEDGYTTSGGLGKGLSGSKRIVDEFSISSKLGEGTLVEIIKWLH